MGFGKRVKRVIMRERERERGSRVLASNDTGFGGLIKMAESVSDRV